MTPIYPWHEAQWQAVQQSFNNGRLPHALLLVGLPGLGKLAFSQALTASLVCQKREAGGVACGHCQGCQLMAAGSHPDIHTVTPEDTGKPIKVDQIRHFSEIMSKKAQMSGYRVATIHPAESMNTNASNALLKTLEEPGENTLIMLVTSQPSLLTATIRSRCQVIEFIAPDTKTCLEWLLQNGIDDTLEAQALLRFSRNAPLAALENHHDHTLESRSEFIEEYLDLKTGVQNPIVMADKWVKRQPQLCIRWMMYWVMDLIRIASTGSDKGVVNAELVHHLHPSAKQLNLANLYVYLDKLQSSLGLLSSQVNKQMMLEDLFITWIKTR